MSLCYHVCLDILAERRFVNAIISDCPLRWNRNSQSPQDSVHPPKHPSMVKNFRSLWNLGLASVVRAVLLEAPLQWVGPHPPTLLSIAGHRAYRPDWERATSCSLWSPLPFRSYNLPRAAAKYSPHRGVPCMVKLMPVTMGN